MDRGWIAAAVLGGGCCFLTGIAVCALALAWFFRRGIWRP